MASLIVIFSAVFVFYVILGYPLLLHLAARRRVRPIARSAELKSVSILLCVYNGDKWIRDKLKA